MPQFQIWLGDEDYARLLRIKDVSETASKAVARLVRADLAKVPMDEHQSLDQMLRSEK